MPLSLIDLEHFILVSYVQRHCKRYHTTQKKQDLHDQFSIHTYAEFETEIFSLAFNGSFQTEMLIAHPSFTLRNHISLAVINGKQ